MVLERAPTDLPSRVADNLFWLGRYAERSEGLVRLLRSVAARLADESGSADTPELSALLQTMAAMDLLPRRFGERVALAELEQEILAMIFKQRRQGSLRQTLNQLRRFASIVRDRLSVDTWRILNQLHHGVRTPTARVQLDAALALLNHTIMEMSAFSGMEMENMTRGNGWRFLDIGRRLERSVNLVNLVRAALSATGGSDAVLEPLLEIADSSMTYRRRYYAQARSLRSSISCWPTTATRVPWLSRLMRWPAISTGCRARRRRQFRPGNRPRSSVWRRRCAKRISKGFAKRAGAATPRR